MELDCFSFTNTQLTTGWNFQSLKNYVWTQPSTSLFRGERLQPARWGPHPQRWVRGKILFAAPAEAASPNHLLRSQAPRVHVLCPGGFPPGFLPQNAFWSLWQPRGHLRYNSSCFTSGKGPRAGSTSCIFTFKAVKHTCSTRFSTYSEQRLRLSKINKTLQW